MLQKRHKEEEDPTTKKEEETWHKIAKFLEKWGIRDGTPEEEVELAALKFTASTGVKHIEAETKPMSKRHKKQMRMLLRDNFPYLGGDGLVKQGWVGIHSVTHCLDYMLEQGDDTEEWVTPITQVLQLTQSKDSGK